MNRKTFLSLINDLSIKANELYSDEILEEIVKLFENYLMQHPHDSEVRIKQSLLFFTFLNDEESAIECVRKILEYDSGNSIAKILLAYFFNCYTYVNAETFEIICSIETTDKELLSLKEYAKSWYFYHNNKEKYKEVLLQSINFCDQFVCNYKHLGMYYLFDEHDYNKAYSCFQKALANIKHIYKVTDEIDFLSIEEFFNYRLRGTHITEPNFESIQNLLESSKVKFS